MVLPWIVFSSQERNFVGRLAALPPGSEHSTMLTWLSGLKSRLGPMKTVTVCPSWNTHPWEVPLTTTAEGDRELLAEDAPPHAPRTTAAPTRRMPGNQEPGAIGVERCPGRRIYAADPWKVASPRLKMPPSEAT